MRSRRKSAVASSQSPVPANLEAPNPERGTRNGRNPEPGTTVKDIIEVLDETAFLPADVVEAGVMGGELLRVRGGEAMATAMPPRAWVESERYAQITEAGEARLLTERGARRRVLEALSGARPMRMDSLIGKGTPTPSARRSTAATSGRSNEVASADAAVGIIRAARTRCSSRSSATAWSASPSHSRGRRTLTVRRALPRSRRRATMRSSSTRRRFLLPAGPHLRRMRLRSGWAFGSVKHWRC